MNSLVSRQIHEQASSLFCWAFAMSSMVRQSLLLALKNLSSCEPKVFESKKLDSTIEYLKRNDFHRKLRNELIMLPIPKINRANHDNTLDTHFLERAVERVSFRHV